MSNSESTEITTLIAYDDGGATVVCDRKNLKAWFRSDTVGSVDAIDKSLKAFVDCLVPRNIGRRESA